MRLRLLMLMIIGLLSLSACSAEEQVTSSGVPYLELLEAHLDRPALESNIGLLATDCGQIKVWINGAGRDGEIVDAICKKATVDRDWELAGEMTHDAFPAYYEFEDSTQ
jgi:hypothetical protein